MLELSLPAYHNQSDFCQNNVGSFHSLLEYDIDNLILTDPAATFGNELPDIQQSDLDYYVPWDSDNALVEARLAPETGVPFIQQAFLSVSEPETRNPTPTSHGYPDDQIINLSTAPFSPQNLNQTTSYSQIPQTEVFADGNAAIVEGQRKFRNDPVSDACKRQRIRNSQRVRYKDPAYAEHLKRNREYQRRRRKNPVDAEYLRKKNRDYQRMRRKDPAKAELDRERSRNYYRKRLQDPAKAELDRERRRNYQRERFKDPAYAEYKRQINKEYHRKRSKDPVYLERKRMLQREHIRRRKQNIFGQANRQREISNHHAYLAYEWELRKAALDRRSTTSISQFSCNP
ncbi:hypothetical protein [Endozoicomonas acroporae]|uniref:hypothetical protein n=1 Tax=Endozoicomonas acroporae TaxID=1701104 RepID=UPI000C78E98F|nr:hypothetical protein [Endozoicomonas acroporae]